MSADHDEWPVIHSYSRADALADGVLVDVTESARAAKFRIPVAMTRTIWTRCVEVRDGVRNMSESVRLWRVLHALHIGIALCFAGTDRLTFKLDVPGADGAIDHVEILAVCGPGDDGDPVLTLMVPGEE
jgi:hypothetical protein